MLPILQDHLTQTQPPAMLDLYERAVELFEKFDLDNYNDGYVDLMLSSDGAVDGVSTFSFDSLHNLTMTYLKQIATEHQITLSSEATMMHYVLVLEFIKNIEYTELVQECYDALSCEDFDNLDKFARCLDIVSDICEEDSMMFLDQVPDCVIQTMRDYFARRVELEVTTDRLDPSIRAVYKEMDKYARVIKGQEMVSYKYLFDVEGAIGLPFEHHFRQNEAYLLNLPLQAMIYECVGFALISEDGLKDPQRIIMECVGKSISDLDRLTKIQYEISKTLIEYRNEVASGIGLVV
jgi:hypothetical protein